MTPQTIYAERGNFLTQAEAEAWAEGPAARDLLTRTAAWRPGYEIAWDTLRRTIWFFKFNPDGPSAINGWRQLTWIAHVQVGVVQSSGGMTDAPQPKTTEDLLTLPIGPAFGALLYDVTDEERARGHVVVGSRRVPVRPFSRRVEIPVAPSVVAFYSEDDEPLSATDEDGIAWKLGRYADGSWFRQR